MVRANIAKYIPNELNYLDPTKSISRVYPKVAEAIENCGGKSATNYMDENFTIKERPTLIGQARQILQEMATIKDAIRENYFNLKILERDFQLVINEFGPDSLEVHEMIANIDASKVYYRGAIKRSVHFCKLYEDICNQLGVETVTEEMIDANQPEEQIKTMFMQSYRAFVEGGAVDEGDLIYADNVDIDPSEVDYECRKFGTYFRFWRRVRSKKEKIEWLEKMWIKYG